MKGILTSVLTVVSLSVWKVEWKSWKLSTHVNQFSVTVTKYPR